MSEPGGRRRAATPAPRSSRRPKGGKRAARPADTQSIPAFVEHDDGIPTPAPAPAPAPEPVVTREPTRIPSADTITRGVPPLAPATPRRQTALEGPTPMAVEPTHTPKAPLVEIVLWVVVILVGGAALVLGNGLDRGPEWLGGAGSVVIGAAYVWVLSARTGGRPLVFSVLTAVAGVVTLVADRPVLDTGAAAVLAAIASVLGVVITVPAVRVLAAVRETCLAIVVAAGGAVAALGFRPQVDVDRFGYAVLVLSLVCAFTLVYRLGAGLHGLGRRGVVIVLVGAIVLVATLLYAEALRRYADSGLVESGLDLVRWCRDHVGAFPRPVEALLGVPALAWGTHMRARRRQGWWVCAFGTAGTAAVASSLMNPGIGVIEVVLSVGYGLVIGLILGYVVIRLDLALTGTTAGRRAVGRRGRLLEEREKAVRPEPKRTGSLL
ncbi:hypothetical protein [Nocardioides sp. Kera G14]|uniref:hypothetical protein n=1 Tax=Nocardioides sp. Kera G14 TaxID=2884264 RepID=UPI001D0F8D23|nr:hypothetical protein [Nocardioides sp. Kera G14]UDY23340.1 hypothetical protein LH076_14945 [Nocardioides sp. Kera G14]